MRKRFIACLTALLLLLLGALPAQAIDTEMSNFSFESGTTGWTQTFGGSSGITVSTDQAYAGTHSLKIVDGSTTTAYGFESDSIPATAGKSYVVYAKSYIASGTADLYLRFYNSSNQVIQSSFAQKTAPLNAWGTHIFKATAPANTSYVRVLLYSNGSNTGTMYWDQIYFSTDLTTVGPLVKNAEIRSATFAANGSGDPAFYVGLNGAAGTDAKMVEVDVNTGSVVEMSMPGATYAHSATTTVDNKIMMGTFPNGDLFRYTPGASAPVNLGAATSNAGGKYIYSLTASNLAGKVYGGSSPGNVFKYESGFTTFSPVPFVSGSNYIQGIAYDAAANALYVGSGGAVAQITRLENATAQRNDNLLPSTYANANTSVVRVEYIGGKVFARLSPTNDMVVLNVTDNPNGTVTVVVDAVFQTHGATISPLHNGKVYHTIGGNLYQYDLTAKTNTQVVDGSGNPINMGGNGYGWGFATLDDQTNFPGLSLVGVANSGGRIKLMKYNLTNHNVYSDYITGISRVNTNISALGAGPDGKMIYAGGDLSGNLGYYKPIEGLTYGMLDGVGQSEGMVSLGNKLYIGYYPGAKIVEYDTSQPWVGGGTNPRMLADLGTTQFQERPFGMAAGDGKVYIGTVATQGELDGALSIFDVASDSMTTIRGIVNDQSIVSVAYYNGYVYAGSAIGGGKNTTPTQTEAKLVKYNVAAGTYTTYTMPSTTQAITALTVGPDNKIWGLAEGYLFIFNPSTNAFDYWGQKFSDVNYATGSNITKDGSLVVGRAGTNKVFGTIKDRFFEIDASVAGKTTTVRYQHPSGAAVENAVKDEFGAIYFSSEHNLLRWAY